MRALLLLLPLLAVACGPVRRTDHSTGPSCMDAEKNGNESDVDCGGDCAACANDRACTSASECASGDCFEGTCRREVSCEEEAPEAMCERLGKSCGALTGLDLCGDRRSVDCGTCPEVVVCEGASSSGLPGSTILGNLTSGQRDALCDFAACAWGGYGRTVECGGHEVSGPESRQECGDEILSCAFVTVGAVEACQLAIAESPCDLMTIIMEDPACDEMRGCLF